MLRIESVLISDELDAECAQKLQRGGLKVTVQPGMSKQQLLQEIPKYDGIVVRSATKVTREVLEAAKKLKLIGRAGTGVDNIDLDAANDHGVLVMNTPAGNSRSAAELTCAMLMSLARHVPQAHAKLKEGVWARKEFMGSEVHGKTLAIVGLGRIGREVAVRMQSFGMKTIGYDPLVDAESAKQSGIERMELEEIWSQADYITVHVPLINATQNLINASTLAKCKKGVYIVNVARGGIVDEDALAVAIRDKQCAGAALDVFPQEPPTNKGLLDLPQVICTPHLGASTHEAQKRVAVEIADNIVALNDGKGLFGALNGAALAAVQDEKTSQWMGTAEALARVVAAATVAPTKFPTVIVTFPVGMKKLESAFRAATIVGLLKTKSMNGLNLVNAERSAAAAALKVEGMACGEKVTVTAGEVSASGYPSPNGTWISHLNGVALLEPLLAIATIVWTTKKQRMEEKTKESLLREVRMVGGGRAAVFDVDDPMAQSFDSNWNVVTF